MPKLQRPLSHLLQRLEVFHVFQTLEHPPVLVYVEDDGRWFAVSKDDLRAPPLCSHASPSNHQSAALNRVGRASSAYQGHLTTTPSTPYTLRRSRAPTRLESLPSRALTYHAPLCHLNAVMTPTVSRRLTPEERELEKKRAELVALETTLADRELELATVKADLRAFEVRYLRIVGARLAELDQIEAQIAEAEARRRPTDSTAQERAERARAQAENSAREAGAAAEPRRAPDFKPSEDLKRLYREAAKRLHPDLATDPGDRDRRTRLIAEANKAYEEGDAARLKAILEEWESSPESVKGEGPGAELVRVIRKIAQVEARLRAIQLEATQLRETELHQLTVKVDGASQEGQDLLAEMASQVDHRIADARRHLALLGEKREGSMTNSRAPESHGITPIGKGELATRSRALMRRGLDLLIAQQSRAIRFPPDRSLGKLYIRARDAREKEDYSEWKWLCEARGTVIVPATKDLFLQVDGELGADSTALAILGPDDLQALSFEGAPVSEPLLESLRGLAELRELYLPSGEVTDGGLLNLRGLTSLETLDLRGAAVVGPGLAHLRGLTGMRELCLAGTSVTDGGLIHLREMVGLQTLDLEGTEVTDAGLAKLRGLSKLRTLDLSGTRITDVGLVHLQELRSLRLLDLTYTQVTRSGLAELASLPALRALTFRQEDESVAWLDRGRLMPDLSDFYW